MKNPFYFLWKLWDQTDEWLCINLPCPLRVWWARLWIRKEEFHASLDFDSQYACSLSREQIEAYRRDLARRRYVAHERTLDS